MLERYRVRKNNQLQTRYSAIDNRAWQGGRADTQEYSTHLVHSATPPFGGLVLVLYRCPSRSKCDYSLSRPIWHPAPVSPYLCIVSSMSLWAKKRGPYFLLPAFSPRYLLLPLFLVRVSPSIAGSMIGHRQEHDHGTHTHTHTLMNRATACLRQDHRPRLWPQKN